MSSDIETLRAEANELFKAGNIPRSRHAKWMRVLDERQRGNRDTIKGRSMCRNSKYLLMGLAAALCLAAAVISETTNFSYLTSLGLSAGVLSFAYALLLLNAIIKHDKDNPER